MTIANLQTFIRFLTHTDTTSLTNANLLILINQEYERIVGNIISETAGAVWQFGDANYSAFPTYTMDLTNGTAAYQIDALTGTPLTIFGVEVLDNNGNYYPLVPITVREIEEKGIAQSEWAPTSGRPEWYEKREHMVVLYPAPDNGVSVTLTAGLRIFFLRTADIYTSAQQTTGTKQPGFPAPWHDALAYAVAYIYAIRESLPNAPLLRVERDKREKELLDFISRRDHDTRKKIMMKKIEYL